MLSYYAKQWSNFKNNYKRIQISCSLGVDCTLSKGNHAPNPKFERPNGKNTKSKTFLNRSRIGASSSLESSMKKFL